ncbi:hypothetical protein L6164_030243 [Bauhinia variegata]|uniref:Uncharacterized protein n=1 Tax=Bauhinia variegata TaxID=167791 RepID=A0ACB9LBR3_BAUVA|nr:hypothetical protein L6164_030243 [Bauhinia variegata]
MDATEKFPDNRKAKNSQRDKNRVSFSASLPSDVSDTFADSFCAVKFSANPFMDIRESILEMILNVGVNSWEEMEELVYCYVALNPPQLHDIIAEAFVSLFCPLCKQGLI